MYTRLFSRKIPKNLVQSPPFRRISWSTLYTPEFKPTLPTKLEPVDHIIKGIAYLNCCDKEEATHSLKQGLAKLNAKKKLTMDEKSLKARALTGLLKTSTSTPKNKLETEIKIKLILNEVNEENEEKKRQAQASGLEANPVAKAKKNRH